jgi:hypothetical protein
MSQPWPRMVRITRSTSCPSIEKSGAAAVSVPLASSGSKETLVAMFAPGPDLDAAEGDRIAAVDVDRHYAVGAHLGVVAVQDLLEPVLVQRARRV